MVLLLFISAHYFYWLNRLNWVGYQSRNYFEQCYLESVERLVVYWILGKLQGENNAKKTLIQDDSFYDTFF